MDAERIKMAERARADACRAWMIECGTKCPPECSRCLAFKAADAELEAAKTDTVAVMYLFIRYDLRLALVLTKANHLEEFLEANRFDKHIEEHVRALKPGQEFVDDGWKLARIV